MTARPTPTRSESEAGAPCAGHVRWTSWTAGTSCGTKTQMTKLPGVPVIVLSGLDRSRAGDVDVTEYLNKSLDFDRLLGFVRKYCQ